jgi:hypothetical protein
LCGCLRREGPLMTEIAAFLVVLVIACAVLLGGDD